MKKLSCFVASAFVKICEDMGSEDMGSGLAGLLPNVNFTVA